MASLTTGLRDRARTEEALLQAAALVFAQQGYDGASVGDVAASAGVNVSLVSRYFGGKAGLLDAVIARFVRRVQAADLDYPPQATLADELYHYLRYRRAVDRANGDLVRLAVSRLATHGSAHVAALAALGNRPDPAIRQRLERLREAGRTGVSPADDTLFALVSYVSFSANFFGDLLGLKDEADLDRLFRRFADLLQGGGIAARGEADPSTPPPV